MKLTLLLAATALIEVCVIATAHAQRCRTNFGGSYTAPHHGIKPDGTPFSTTASFDFKPTGKFHVRATITTPSKTFPVSAFAKWWWTGPCDIAIERAAFVGHVSDDGSFVRLEARDEEFLMGYALRR